MVSVTPLRFLTTMLLLACFLSSCTRTAPEDAVRQRVAELGSAIESRDLSAMQQFFAEDFVGNDGVDRGQVRAIAATTLLRYRDIGLSFGPLEVRLPSDGNATVSFTAMTTGRSGQALLPGSAQVYEIETAWRETDGDWVMYHAKWSPRL